MPGPTLSILVPCYDCEDTIDITLRSLALQELDDIEVVLVDDASTDETPDILDSWSQGHDWIRVIKNPRNVGIGTTRNIALEAARGNYIGFVDADDWVSSTYYCNLVDVLERSGVDFVKTDHVRVTGTKRVIVEAPEVRRNQTLDPKSSVLPIDEASMVDYAYVWAGVYRTSFLRQRGIVFDNGLYSAEDRPFTWRVHLEADRYRCVPEFGYFYRRDESGSLTQTGDRRQLDFFKATTTVLRYLHDGSAADELLAKAYRQALALVVFHYDRRERLTAEVWAEYKAQAARLIDRLDSTFLARTLADIGPRRVAIVRSLATRELPTLEEAPVA